MLDRARITLQREDFMRACALLVFALLFCLPASGHAVLVESTPAANGKVRGPGVSIRLRFDSRIDAGRSRLSLIRPDGAVEFLKLLEQPSPDTLTGALTGLKAGEYKLRWQVLAADGHITRGEIPFTVAGN